MSSFEELPLEIQEQIVEQNPEMVTTLSRIRPFYQATSRTYLQTLCQQPITPSEISNYLDGRPTLFGTFGLSKNYFTLYTRSSGDRYFYTDFGLEVLGVDITGEDLDPEMLQLIDEFGPLFSPEYRPRIGIEAVDTHFDDYFTQDIKETVESYLRSRRVQRSELVTNFPEVLLKPELDLVSIYRILQTRLGCVSRQPDFAKTEVLRRLDLVYNNYTQNPDILLLLTTHGYLFLQASVLNVYPSPTIYAILEIAFTSDGLAIADPNEPENFDKANSDVAAMRQEIEPLYLKVRQALEDLRD